MNARMPHAISPGAASGSAIDQNARKGGQPSREGAKNRVGPDSFAPQRYRDVGARTQTLQPGAVHHSSVV
jgi:hypothetical protein